MREISEGIMMLITSGAFSEHYLHELRLSLVRHIRHDTLLAITEHWIGHRRSDSTAAASVCTELSQVICQLQTTRICEERIYTLRGGMGVDDKLTL